MTNAYPLEVEFRGMNHEQMSLALVSLSEELTLRARGASAVEDVSGLTGLNEIQHHVLQQVRHLLLDEPGYEPAAFFAALRERAQAWDVEDAVIRSLERVSESIPSPAPA